MNRSSLNEKNSPLQQEQAQWLNRFTAGLSPQQIAWLGGYFTALTNTPTPPTQATVRPSSEPGLTILYGTQTGNSESLAEVTQAWAREIGVTATVKNMADYKPAHLKKENNLLVIISTHGEGDPPDQAADFYDFLRGKRAPKLEHTHFSVLALGDASYENFCQTGVDVDRQLEKLGAQRMHPRLDCDVDYEAPAEQWLKEVLGVFSKRIAAGHGDNGDRPVPPLPPAPASPLSVYSKKNPFPATMLEKIKLNGRGSNKETYHIELSLEGSDLTYEPGDSLGVFPANNPRYVQALIETLRFDPHETVSTHSGEIPLREAFLRFYEITMLTRPVIKAYAERSRVEDLQALLNPKNKEDLATYIHGREIIDLVNEYPIKGLTASAFISMLRTLPPRLYSIASSIQVHPDEVHLTVAATRYHAHGRDREGVCSTYLVDRINENHPIPVYVDTNNRFRLPTDPATPIIMIGPGTGVAPFRAFMEEREWQGAPGKNWLFFGDQHFTSDFLYQVEWQSYLKNGLLSHLDVAFSRDCPEKIYVQHRMQEKSKELFSWLQEGAHLYVCGDERHMAHDVHDAVIAIVRREGRVPHAEAEQYVKKMQQEKRYQRDVY